MLPRQLRSLYEDLQSIERPNEAQLHLIAELEFIDESKVIADEFKNYVYFGLVKESLSVAIGTCPVCGKRY